jgi:hypothetical protein
MNCEDVIFRILSQQRPHIRMDIDRLLCDRGFGLYSRLRQPFDPPDPGKESADLLGYVIAILIGHKSTIS